MNESYASEKVLPYFDNVSIYTRPRYWSFAAFSQFTILRDRRLPTRLHELKMMRPPQCCNRSRAHSHKICKARLHDGARYDKYRSVCQMP